MIVLAGHGYVYSTDFLGRNHKYYGPHGGCCTLSKLSFVNKLKWSGWYARGDSNPNLGLRLTLQIRNLLFYPIELRACVLFIGCERRLSF